MDPKEDRQKEREREVNKKGVGHATTLALPFYYMIYSYIICVSHP